MKSRQQRDQASAAAATASRCKSFTLLISFLTIGLIGSNLGDATASNTTEIVVAAKNVASDSNLSTVNIGASESNGNNPLPMSNKSMQASGIDKQHMAGEHYLQSNNPSQSSLQAKAASNYLASRAATGLQLKQRSTSKPMSGPAATMQTSNIAAMGDLVGLDTALDSQMDLQTAAGEHKKYILVKKKPKHKKIKMEVYKPKMKYKKIKMKVPVKKMKKKKVKGYLIKKEKHYH